MHEEQKERRTEEMASPDIDHEQMEPEFDRCFSFSLKVVVTGFVVISYLLSTDAKLVSG